MNKFKYGPLVYITVEDTDEEGNPVQARWLQTRIGQGYVAKDRSGKLDDFEAPDLTLIIKKLGFDIGEKKNG